MVINRKWSGHDTRFNAIQEGAQTILDMAQDNSHLPLIPPATTLREAAASYGDARMAGLSEEERTELRELLGTSFERTFQLAAIGMTLTKAHGICVAANPALCRMLEYSEPELLGRPFNDITHPDDIDKSLARHQQIAEGEVSSYSIEKRYITKSGRILHAQVTVMTVSGADERPRFLVAEVQDLSSLHQSEQALRQSEARYRSLVETSPDPILLLGHEGLVLFCNPQTAVLLGYDRAEELIGSSAFNLVVPEDRESVQPRAEQMFRTGNLRDLEIALIGKDGRRVICRVSMSPLRDDIGGSENTLCILHDVTHQRQAEDALRQSEARYRGLVETSPDPILLVGTDGRVLFCNAQTAVLLGYNRPEELVGRSSLELSAPAEREGIRQRAEQLIETSDLRDMEYTLIGKDGRRVICRANISLLRDDADETQGAICVLHDVTRQRQAEDALRASEARFRAVVEDQTELVCRATPDTTLTFVNDAYCRFFSASAEQLIGSSFLKLVPEQEHAGMLALYDDLARNPRTMGHIHPVIAADGSVRWQEWTNRAVVDAQGRVTEIQSVGRDVTRRKHAEDAEREQRELAEALRDTAAALSSTLDSEKVLDRILENAQRVVSYDAANIMLVDLQADEARIGRSRGYAELGLSEWVLQLRFKYSDLQHLQLMQQTNSPLIVPDTWNDPVWMRVPGDEWLRSYAGVPVQVRGQFLGFLGFDSKTPGFFQPIHAQRLRAFADQAAIAIDNAQLYETARRNVERLTLLHHAAIELAHSESLPALYTEVLHWARLLTSANITELMRVEGKDQLAVVIAAGVPDDTVGKRVPFGQGMTGTAAATRQIQQTSDYAAWAGHQQDFVELGLRSGIALPLICQDRLVGVLALGDYTRREFDANDIYTLELYASLVAVSLEQHLAMLEAREREAEASTLSSQLARAQEEERARIAEQLHDSIGYRLVELSKSAEAMLADLGENHQQAERLRANLETLRETHQQARTLAMDLNARMLADLGLSPAARQYVQRLSESAGIDIRLHVTGRFRRLPPDVESVAFRSLQECLINALRHAKATELSAQIHFGGRLLRLTVQDNGQGFDPAEVAKHGTVLGLPEMRRQVQALRGDVHLESTARRGTVIEITLPMRGAVYPASALTKLRVLVVDDHATTRDGIRSMLNQSDEFVCVGEAADGMSAVSQVELSRPDLVLMDIRMRGLSGLDAISMMARRFPQVSVVMFTSYDEDAYLQHAFQAGAKAFVLKTDDNKRVLEALRAAHSGERYVSPQLRDAWERLQRRPLTNDPLEPLTAREREVFHLVVSGNTSPLVAAQMGIAHRTVEVYRRSIGHKLGLRRLNQWMDFARRNALL